jgi:hypothetical protein
MATVIDTLVTEFKLNAAGFHSGVGQVKADMASLHSAFGGGGSGSSGLGAQVSGALDKVGQGLGAVADVATGFVAAGTAAIGVIGGLGAAAIKFGSDAKVAMDAAASFDTMERTFAGALGSVEKGKSMMAYLETYADNSAFTLEALASASKQLAAGGVEVKRFLPVMERVALVASGIDPSGLQEVAGALLRAQGGGFGEAMESLRRAGIGANDFRAQGVQISKSGEVSATPEQWLSALERISEGRLKSIADAVSGGSETKISNIGDAIGKAERSIGKTLNDQFLPSIVKATEGLNKFTENGGFAIVADEIADLVPKIENGKGVYDSLIGMAASFESVKSQFEMGGAIVGAFFDRMIDIATHIPVVSDIWKGAFGGIGDGFQDQTAINEANIRGQMDLKGRLKKKKDDAEKAADEAEKKRQADEKANKLGPMTSFLAGIERNTADTARNTRKDNLENLIVGGGELARRGLDKTQLAALMRPRSGGSDPDLREIQTLLTNMAVVIHRAGQLSAQRLMLDHARAGGR